MPGERLISLLRDQKITTVTFPPSVLALLPPEEFPALCTIIVAGEACWTELVNRWAVNGRLFCNAYGPTENTVCISIAECAPDGRKPTIGRALTNVQVYVLDENMRPAPLGVPGEIMLGAKVSPELISIVRTSLLLASSRIHIRLFPALVSIEPAIAVAIYPMVNSNFSGAWTSKSSYVVFESSSGEIEAVSVPS